MSGKAQGWAWEHGPATAWGRGHLGITKPDRCAQVVFVAIADGASQTGTHSHPGLAAMADGTGYSRRAVTMAIDRLVEWGYLEIEERGGGRGRATVYALPGVSDLGWRPRSVQKVHRLPEPNGADEVHGSDPSKGAGNGEKPCTFGPETVHFEDPAPSCATNPQRTDPTSSAANAAITQFADFFWPVYPARNGKRLERGKALEQWRRLSIDERRAAVRGARHYAASGQIPKDAHRWLRDRCWEDWQTPAEPAHNGNGHRSNGRGAGEAAVLQQLLGRA